MTASEPLPLARWVVVGTGTGVGKTEVSVALLQGARLRGIPAVGLKPLETGPEAEGDSVRLGSVGIRVAPFFRADEPISPHLAARRAGVALSAADVVRWVTAHEGPAIVETAGGLFSPISDTETNADWVRRLPATGRVLVCPGRLGVLHDVGSVLRAAPDLGWSALVVSAVAGRAEAALQASELARAVLPQCGRQMPVVTWALDDDPAALWDTMVAGG